MTATKSSVSGLYVGTSGWSYPSWRPDFYPPGTKPGEFLAHYATRFRTVELNTTGYRIPGSDQFGRWAEQTPSGFRFAVKLDAHRRGQAAAFEEGIARLGDRLGPIRVVVISTRDEGLLALIFGTFGPERRYAFDFRHESWEGVELPENAVRVGALEADAPFRYLRFREPPYDEQELTKHADTVRPLLADGIEVYCYYRHEEQPTAPAYAGRLLELI
ncbi:MAG TPA: DUF72 domain-containing protein [Gaiellaceae bacterium]